MDLIPVRASVVAALNDEEVAQTQASCDAIGHAAAATVAPGQFLYFAAFDGTNNDKLQVALSGAPLQTNVAELFEQVETRRAGHPELKAGYFAGVGTGGERGGFSARSSTPTPFLLDTVKQAYLDFEVAATGWRGDHPDAHAHPLLVAVTGFSRGAGAAVAFARMLNERGFLAPGQAGSAPERVQVAVTLLLDPVFTGIALDLRLPQNLLGPVVVVRALDEFRYAFPAADFGADPRVQTIAVAGNHGNVGGFYDRGIGALVLMGATDFLRGCGVLIGDVKPSRRFDDTQPVQVYSEGVDTYRKRIWSESGVRGQSTRLTEHVNQGPRW